MSAFGIDQNFTRRPNCSERGSPIAVICVFSLRVARGAVYSRATQTPKFANNYEPHFSSSPTVATFWQQNVSGVAATFAIWHS